MNLESNNIIGFPLRQSAATFVYKSVCSIESPDVLLDMNTEELKEFWNLTEPLAGAGTQVVWLSSDTEQATQLINLISPLCEIKTNFPLSSFLRPIIVYEDQTEWKAIKLAQENLIKPVFISTPNIYDFDGMVTIRAGLTKTSGIRMYVTGSSVQASAAAAGVIAALITKHPELETHEIQKILINNSSTSMGRSALRRVWRSHS